jgi:L,D-peptidoglycan transpeptidase YkuD (ErfK/YbiS/YcfS/YnhG family)
VIISRRVFFGALLATFPAPSPTSLAYAGGRLTWPGGAARAACGWGGVKADKREGDGASPAGTFPLVSAFYRPDRLATPRTGLPIAALGPEDAWVDDPTDANYNRLVSRPYPASHEDLWRDDALYDVIVVIGYNSDPVIAGAGSAIFLHVAKPDFSPTEGCIAIAEPVLLSLLGLLGPGSTITIAP